ncbi:protein tiptop isoform X1 [Cataglyphis hispanica]|uniref:protein tiptop isoform X1 n=2 Tax=Cataglyphis hispanica TaxID=1086592 RepID=UPI0021803C51|nr:protein tiptop isoform X1 [Cataglyphis hispanica]XP_050452259.1 protein tiptop isoform X1 [Cataglyphis hispanica]XP_050452260.1 protein tiptop isoform X1 [Cataglyphis hispanica]XP_050452262.1 protein tiptop isoform X1 [Cataglyphis hispanica]XP_050452263.1 protein tiptop isoform X1 [Cataglyphis hispanica]XP_050452264.1 protein tiptop isoform X1 [Cataglyphis hispanica]
MRSKQQPRPSFRWPQQRGDNLTGEDGVEGSAPGTDLQGEEGDCVDEDGPISPSERGCAPVAKEDEDADGTDEEDDEEASPPTPPPSATSRLNPTILRDTGPPDREPMSPRCPSRDSRESSGPATGSPPPPATRNSASPVSPSSIVPLPLGTHPLLPPHSAAVMAAYLQQTHQRLLLGHSPLSRGSVSPLVSSSCSPPAATPGLLVSPTSVGEISPSATPLPAVLDFSTRKASPTEEDEEEQILNLSKPPTPSSSTETNNGPLDLSVSSRKRVDTENSSPPLPRKSSRLASSTSSTSHQETAPGAASSGFGRPPIVSPWTSPVVASHFPYFAAAVAAVTSQQQLSPKSTSGVVDHHQLWNGKMKPPTALEKSYQPSEATKALEKMSELSKLGGEDLFRSSSGGGAAVTGASAPATTSSSRHSAWQSHWLNKGADQAKDVLKCVWCKQSFPTLAAMTTHMKEAKHCGVNMPVPPPAPGIHSQQTSMPTIPPPQQPHQPQTSSSNTGSNNSATPSSKQSPSDLNLLIKETMPLPRKLVRGQDVWLGKGAEQTRQILKCMWCGQSFRSLAEMTSHMQQTQHYTNIISQEQIISWKSSDESKSANTTGSAGAGGNAGAGSNAGVQPGGGSGPHSGNNGGPGAGATSSHVSAVLTCKVCDQAFSSLKELSNHMVKNSHYKEHIMRSITESGGRRRQTREKRKKSLPVRKLLELERAQNEFKNGDAAANLTHSLGKQASRITCEKCGEKIETPLFVEHIRQCIGAGTVGVNQRNFLKNALMSNHLPATLPPSESGRKSVNEETSSISSRHHRSPSSASDATTPGKDTPTPNANESTAPIGTSPSVLNAIEKLIEKSFDSRVRHGTPGMHHAQSGAPMGTSILKRLGIDESVDYTKPLVDPQTMNLLRSYQQQQQHQQHYANAARRERSGSESSSISERGSGRTDTMTPERRMDLSTTSHERHSSSLSHHHRVTPEKQTAPLPSRHHQITEESGDEESSTVVVKKEPRDEETEERGANEEEQQQSQSTREVFVKKEIVDDCRDEEDQSSYNHRRSSLHETPEDGREVLSPRMNPPTPRPTNQVEQIARSPCRNSTSSPTSSDRSVTPRGTPDTKASSSLGALSSMFDSLSGGNSGGGGSNVDSQGRKTSSHPLAALQKLCDKTETRGPSASGASRSGGSSGGSTIGPGSGSTVGVTGPGPGPTPGAILAFSWACNDAVVTADSIMKCAFCDTPFISKGAYRHHLSKMHFVKDGVIPDPLTIGRSAAAAAAAAAAVTQSTSGGPSRNSSSPPTSQRNKSPPLPQANGSPSQSAASPLEESPHSKFLKYTELAKQLSSKYV